MGRRAEKRVYTWQYVADHYDWVDSHCRRFVWYDWLPLLEIQVTNPYSPGVAGGPPAESAAILRKYTWGLDLAGQNGSVNSIDAAGGIGGLLACHDTAGTTGGANPTADDKQYIYLHDANGNVGQVIDWTAAAVSPPSTAWSADRMVATYEYDAYGNVTASAGASADDNPFRFSTKYWDDETGLGYWGYRYYSPRLGRWVSRDPIEEFGGLLVYGYVANAPNCIHDAYGLSFWCCEDKCPKGAKECKAELVVGHGTQLVSDPYSDFKKALAIKNYTEQVVSAVSTLATKPLAEACLTISKDYVVGRLIGLLDPGKIADELYRVARQWVNDHHPMHAWVKIERRVCQDEACYLGLFGNHLDWSEWTIATQGSSNGYTSGDYFNTGWVSIATLPFGIHTLDIAKEVAEKFNKIISQYCE